MTPSELQAARKTLRLSQQGLADALGLSARNGARTVRRYESGDWPIPPEVERDVRRLLAERNPRA